MMKKFKLIISIILILCIMPISGVYSQETAETVEVEFDITSTDEYKKLEAFGIFTEEENVIGYSTISRSVFMSFVMKCYPGYNAFQEITDVVNPFIDVNESTIGYNAIIMAKYAGLISGDNGAEFRPDDDITLNEATKILVSLLGNTGIAEQKGGYPTGYMSVANRLELFDGCQVVDNNHISASEFTKLLLNTLETEITEKKVFSINEEGKVVSRVYSSLENETLLNSTFNIYSGEGILTSNGVTSINGVSLIKKGMVEIDDKTYLEGTTNAFDLIGYNTEYYYKPVENNTEYELVYISPYKNNIVNTVTRLIVPGGVSTTSFEYYKSNEAVKTTEIKLSGSATLIYNGGQKSLTAADLCPDNGTVTLIDNNNDKKYDVAIVMNYRTIQVSTISNKSYNVLDTFGSEAIVLDPENEDYKCIIEVDGKNAEFSNIVAKNIISYAVPDNDNPNIKYVKVSTKTIEGTIETVSDNFIVINGEKYEYLSTLDSVKPGMYGIFYLDVNNKIAARTAEYDVVYGYLNNIAKINSERAMAQIFTENNRWVELEFNKKVKCSSDPASNPDSDSRIVKAIDLYNELMALDDYRQLITYTVTEEGKINMLKTAQSFTPYSTEEEKAIDEDIFRKYPEITNVAFNSSLNSLGNSLIVSDATKIFWIPDQSLGDADLNEFKVIKTNFFTDTHLSHTYVNVTPYDFNRGRIAGAVVLKGNSMPISKKSNFFIVNGLASTLNSDGIVVDALEGFYLNSELTLPLSEEASQKPELATLETGDILQFRMDDEGNIMDFQIKYDASLSDDAQPVIQQGGTSYAVAMGTIHYVDAENNRLIIDSGVPENKIIARTNTSTIISLYDRERKTISVGSIADLEKGSKFFTNWYDYRIIEMIVFI